MNILFVADVSIQDDLSGAERVLFEQTTRLAARGHTVDIMTRRLAKHRSDYAMIHHVRERRYRVNQQNDLVFFISGLRNGTDLFEKLSHINQYDCINFQQPFSAFAVSRSSSSKKIKKIYTCHSLSFEEYASRNAKILSAAAKITQLFQCSVRKWIEKKVLNSADRISVLSRYTQDKLLNIYQVPRHKTVVIPGGIDLERFRPPADKRLVRERLKLPLDKTILLTVRGLEPRMGIDNLIRAMPEILKSLPEAYLVIGGTGPLKAELAAITQRLKLDHYIRFTGFIPEEDLSGYYQAADLFILPTTVLEGFGLVTLEALASGTPVLGTPVGGTLEILGAFDRRFLFGGASRESIAGLITEVCHQYRNEAGKWQTDSRRCRRFVEENYSWEKNVEATERLFFESLPCVEK